MDKQEIIDEIRRTAHDNGGEPLGATKFQSVTGVKENHWRGVYWANWGEALTDAGYSPNEFGQAYDETWLIETLIEFIREGGTFPTVAQMKLKRRRNPDFPSVRTFRDRLGNKGQLCQNLIAYCQSQGGRDDVIELCKPFASDSESPPPTKQRASNVRIGFVYLMKSGDFYKVGRSDAPGRREYDLVAHRPEGVETIHTIKTDDPEGVEAYWHNRFRNKRKRNEWFDLTRDDVAAFKRWVRIH